MKSARRHYLSSVGTALGGQLLLLASGSVVARMLGVEGRGYFAELTLWPLLVSMLVAMGGPLGVTYFISRSPHGAYVLFRKAMRTALWQTPVAAAACAVAFWLRRVNLDAVDQGTMVLMLFVGPLVILQQYGLSVAQGLQRFSVFNVLRTVQPAVYAVVVVGLFATQGGSLFSIAVAHVTATAVSTALIMVWARGAVLTTRGSTVATDGLLRFGFKGFLGYLSPLENLRLDQVAVALLTAPAALGLYVAGSAFVSLPRLVAQSLGMVRFPVVARMVSLDGGTNDVRQGNTGATLPMAGFIVAIGLGLIVVIPYVLPLLFGDAFSAAVPVGQILVVGGIFGGLRRIVVEGARGLGRPGVSTAAELVMYPWLVVSMPIGAYWRGVEGIALAVSSAQFFAWVVAVILVRRLCLAQE